MGAKTRLIHAAARGLGRGGFELRRHPAARRQRILSQHGVDLVIDVGAADGGYGSSLREFGYDGAILSFEPQAAAYERLGVVIANEPRWDARHLALGAKPGELTMNIASNSTSSSILPMLAAHIDAAPSVRYIGTEKVAVSRLDDELAQALGTHSRPFLKIDTQGFERDVLTGGPETVAACVGLQLELSLVPLYDGGMLIDEAVAWAYDHGFRMVGLEQGYAAPTGDILQIDGVFVRPSRTA